MSNETSEMHLDDDKIETNNGQPAPEEDKEPVVVMAEDGAQKVVVLPSSPGELDGETIDGLGSSKIGKMKTINICDNVDETEQLGEKSPLIKENTTNGHGEAAATEEKVVADDEKEAIDKVEPEKNGFKEALEGEEKGEDTPEPDNKESMSEEIEQKGNLFVSYFRLWC